MQRWMFSQRQLERRFKPVFLPNGKVIKMKISFLLPPAELESKLFTSFTSWLAVLGSWDVILMTSVETSHHKVEVIPGVRPSVVSRPIGK